MKSFVHDQYSCHIWEWIDMTGSFLQINHIAGVDNEEADTASRYFNLHTEWTMSQIDCQAVVTMMNVGSPDINLCFRIKLQSKNLCFIHQESRMPDNRCFDPQLDDVLTAIHIPPIQPHTQDSPLLDIVPNTCIDSIPKLANSTLVSMPSVFDPETETFMCQPISPIGSKDSKMHVKQDYTSK